MDGQNLLIMDHSDDFEPSALAICGAQVALDLPTTASVLDVALPVGSVQDASSNLFAGTDAGDGEREGARSYCMDC